jgi:hypothetical protein
MNKTRHNRDQQRRNKNHEKSPCNAANSIGSPANVGSPPLGPATETMLWHAARTRVVAAVLPLMGTTEGGVASEDAFTTP